MFETTIRLSRDSNVPRLLEWFAQSCRASGMHADQVDDAVEKLGGAMRELAARGREVGRHGRFTETRRIATRAFAVTLVADYGAKRGLIRRIVDAFRGATRPNADAGRSARARRKPR